MTVLTPRHQSPAVLHQARFSLLFDWFFFDAASDNIMNIEPAALLMVHSLAKYSDVTLGLIQIIISAPEDLVNGSCDLNDFFFCDMIQKYLQLIVESGGPAWSHTKRSFQFCQSSNWQRSNCVSFWILNFEFFLQNNFFFFLIKFCESLVFLSKSWCKWCETVAKFIWTFFNSKSTNPSLTKFEFFATTNSEQ